jgi:hypothetical protein
MTDLQSKDDEFLVLNVADDSPVTHAVFPELAES